MGGVLGRSRLPAASRISNHLFYLMAAIGGVSYIAAIHPIIFPRIWLEEISKDFTKSQVGIRFPFFSTHPSYVFLDLILFIPAFIVFYNGQAENLCEYNFFWGQGLAVLLSALSFPALRLIFWYVLGKKIFAMQARNVWIGIIWWYLIALPLLAVFFDFYIEKNIIPRSNITTVSRETFKGGLDEYPEYLDKIVRLRGVIKQGIAKCGLWGKPDRTDYPYGTIVLDMGEGNGEIIVQAKKNSQVVNLEIEAKRRKEEIFEVFGRLSRLPNPQKKMLCGIGKLSDQPPPGGRALLEIEMP